MTQPFAPVDLPARLSACSSTQEKVRVTMAAFGGYWRPLAAVARLLEELGELGDELGEPLEEMGESDLDRGKVAAELADLWIITTALADQYLATVREPRSAEAGDASLSVARGVSGEPPHTRSGASPHTFAHLVAAAGLIARIVNYYDGPKTPRSLHGWISIETAVADFHRALRGIAAECQVDLRAAVEAKLAAIPQLDSGRFFATHDDPATAPCLESFRRLPAVAGGPLAKARLWGGPDWGERSIALYAEAIAPSLVSFAKAAEPERLDAYVIPGPPARSVAAGEDWIGQMLTQLATLEPQLSRLALRFDAYTLSSERDDEQGHDDLQRRAVACVEIIRNVAQQEPPG